MKNAGANHCYKPFALIIEDFDENGNVLSSVPLTFFGQVVDNATCDDDDGETITLDIEKQSAMLEAFVTAPASDGKFEFIRSFFNVVFRMEYKWSSIQQNSFGSQVHGQIHNKILWLGNFDSRYG